MIIDTIAIMPTPKDRTGIKYGRLTALQIHSKKKPTSWLCRCDCGKEIIVISGSLATGNTKSCGCLLVDSAIKTHRTHGLTKTLTYPCWTQMVGRCTEPDHPDFATYGMVGIRVCSRWLDISLFVKDVGHRPSKYHTIERIDNKGHYEPGNCRWATRKEQANNRRSNVFITYNGETKTLAQWSDFLGFEKWTISNRLKAGWSHVEALTVPVRKRR